MKKLALLLLIVLSSCSSDNYDSGIQHIGLYKSSKSIKDDIVKGREVLTDPVLAESVVKEQEPCWANPKYRTPKIKCFSMVGTTIGVAVVEYENHSYLVISSLNPKSGKLDTFVYHSFEGESCP